MDIETVRVITNLWPWGVIAFAIIFILVYRRPIMSLLERCTRFRLRGGPTEVLIESKPEEEERKLKLHAEKPAASEEKPTQEPISKLEEEELTTTGQWENKMIEAYLKRDMNLMEEAFQKMQGLETDAIKKLTNEAFYLWLRYERGDTFALRRLQDMAEQTELGDDVRYEAYKYIGDCYQSSSDFDKAVRAYESAAHISRTEWERARAIVEIATCLYKDGKQEDAFVRLMDEIGKASDSDALSRLYKGLASLYEQTKDWELRAFALEKAVENRPNDVDLHFNAAYSYGQKELNAIALLHYKTLLQFRSDYPMALNNIGVHYGALEMPIYAAESFRKAAELNETLAAANLAFKFLSAGFDSEASEVLDKAKKQAQMHANVGKAISAISEARKAESETEQSSLEVAREQQKFFTAFADAYFTRKPKPPRFSGSWQSSDGLHIEVTQRESSMEANWISDKRQHKFEGAIRNWGAKVTILREQYILSTGNFELAKESVGYAYLTPDEQQIHIIILKDGKHSFMVLSRKR